MLNNLKAYAARKRLQAQFKNGKSDLLNVDEVPEEMKQEIEMTSVWTQEGYPIEVAVDAIGKGREPTSNWKFAGSFGYGCQD